MKKCRFAIVLSALPLGLVIFFRCFSRMIVHGNDCEFVEAIIMLNPSFGNQVVQIEDIGHFHVIVRWTLNAREGFESIPECIYRCLFVENFAGFLVFFSLLPAIVLIIFQCLEWFKQRGKFRGLALKFTPNAFSNMEDEPSKNDNYIL